MKSNRHLSLQVSPHETEWLPWWWWPRSRMEKNNYIPFYPMIISDVDSKTKRQLNFMGIFVLMLSQMERRSVVCNYALFNFEFTDRCQTRAKDDGTWRRNDGWGVTSATQASSVSKKVAKTNFFKDLLVSFKFRERVILYLAETLFWAVAPGRRGKAGGARRCRC